MDQETRIQGANPDDLFAEAVERIQAGEPVEAVVASYPARYQRALRDLLAIVATATQIHSTAVPPLEPARRDARRASFLAVASTYRAQRSALARLPATATPAPLLASKLAAGLSHWIGSLLALRAVRPLAAVAATVALLLIVNTLVTLAESAVPGDLTYPVKQWIRSQQLYLAPKDNWQSVRQAQEQELAADIQKARATAVAQQVIITVESNLLFHGYGEGYLNIGDLQVLPNYLDDAGQGDLRRMAIRGELRPGVTVRLRYQIVPASLASDGERAVRGVSLEVLASQPIQPTPIPSETLLPPPTPTALGVTPQPACRVRPLPGWFPYPVQSGDTLAEIAARTGTTVDTLRSVNCISNDFMIGGAPLLAPPTFVPPAVETLGPGTPTGEALPGDGGFNPAFVGLG
ncbi:MAG TPA: LysM peptidoglycan-binding domain-containing protein, partial [Caldilineaceae bacterium]|nr:LysM peptidoglycan-binding domain-containing protein [Caldilineaceae bacterium]